MDDTQILLIGYGNTLRGDDGIGPHIAEKIGQQQWPGVRTCSVPQLTPELSAELSEVSFAIFVDAAMDSKEPVRIEPLGPRLKVGHTTHLSSIEGLLALAENLYGRSPESWAVKVQGADFSLVDRLSSAARRNAELALLKIGELLEMLMHAGKRGTDGSVTKISV